jgi:hypothetical protein
MTSSLVSLVKVSIELRAEHEELASGGLALVEIQDQEVL